MLEAAVRDSLEKLWFQEEVAETGRVDTDVASLGLVAGSSAEVALLGIAIGGSSTGSAISWLELLVGVIDKIFLAGGHDGGDACVSGRVGVFFARGAASACSSRMAR